MSYALVGDTVNSASRIEGLTKEYECDIILSQTTYNLLCERNHWYFLYLTPDL